MKTTSTNKENLQNDNQNATSKLKGVRATPHNHMIHFSIKALLEYLILPWVISQMKYSLALFARVINQKLICLNFSNISHGSWDCCDIKRIYY